MKIAIHHSQGTFSDRWVAYCEKEQIPYKLVDCYKNDIIQQLDDCGDRGSGHLGYGGSD